MSDINFIQKIIINNPQTFYSNKLLKMSTNCINNNINNAENTINSTYNYLTIIYKYLQQIKEELDSLDKSNILYSKLLGILKIMSVYVTEIDYTIDQAIYDDKLLIVSPDSTQKEITFAFAFPYNHTSNYPIGIPIASVVNNFIFKFVCPILNSQVLQLDIVTNPIVITKFSLDINLTQIPDTKTLVKIGSAIGIFIENTDNIFTFDIFYKPETIINNTIITDLDGLITYGTITSIQNSAEIDNYTVYPHISIICSYLQYITDHAIKYTWDEIDNISYYLFICEINTKLIHSFCKRII